MREKQTYSKEIGIDDREEKRWRGKEMQQRREKQRSFGKIREDELKTGGDYN